MGTGWAHSSTAMVLTCSPAVERGLQSRISAQLDTVKALQPHTNHFILIFLLEKRSKRKQKHGGCRELVGERFLFSSNGTSPEEREKLHARSKLLQKGKSRNQVAVPEKSQSSVSHISVLRLDLGLEISTKLSRTLLQLQVECNTRWQNFPCQLSRVHLFSIIYFNHFIHIVLA